MLEKYQIQINFDQLALIEADNFYIDAENRVLYLSRSGQVVGAFSEWIYILKVEKNFV